MRSPSPLLFPVVLAGLLLAGCGSDLPPTPTEPTWSTGSTSAAASTTVTPVSAVPTSTALAAGAGAEDVDLRRPRRTTVVARPRPTTTAATKRVVVDRDTATSPPTTSKTAPQPSGRSYRSCQEARDAGAAPLFAGKPGYSTALDRDGDGIACDD